jgi:hypothetical protein
LGRIKAETEQKRSDLKRPYARITPNSCQVERSLAWQPGHGQTLYGGLNCETLLRHLLRYFNGFHIIVSFAAFLRSAALKRAISGFGWSIEKNPLRLRVSFLIGKRGSYDK